MIHCPKCKTMNPEHGIYCNICGTRLIPKEISQNKILQSAKSDALLYVMVGTVVLLLALMGFLFVQYSYQKEIASQMTSALEEMNGRSRDLDEKLTALYTLMLTLKNEEPSPSLVSTPLPRTTLPSTSPPPKPLSCVLGTQDGLTVISWQCADQYYGKEVIVEGVIVAAKNTGKICFLNFHTDYKRYFTAVIFASDFGKFPQSPETHYLNKKVRVRGIVKEYQGKPEIVLKSPSQIWIVQ